MKLRGPIRLSELIALCTAIGLDPAATVRMIIARADEINSQMPVTRDDSHSSTLAIHDLRHTAASIMVASGASVKAVQRQLGHASASMTLDTYADLFDDDLDTLMERVGERFAAKCGHGVGTARARADHARA